jgi:hypothetical protein
MEMLLIAFVVIVALIFLTSNSRSHYGYDSYSRRYQPPPVVIQTQPDYYRRNDNGSAFVATILFMAMIMFLLFYWGNDAPQGKKERNTQAVHYRVERE